MRKKIKEAISELKSAVHVEVTLRIGACMLLGYSIVFMDVMPIDTSLLLGILVPFCSMLFPTLAFAFGSLVVPFFGLLVFVYTSSTFLLAVAATGGTGPFLAAFTIWCFGVTFLRWDKVEGNKTSIILILVIFQTILIWPTYRTVIDGFVLPNPYVSKAVQQALMNMVQPSVQDAISLGPGTHLIDIISGGLKGRTAQITIGEDADFQVYIEGGMWLVRSMWTSTGTQNPLASYQIMMIFTCWLIAILSVTYLIPPVRTMRSALSRSILPGALMEAATAVRLFSEEFDAPQEPEPEPEDEVHDLNTKSSKAKVDGALSKIVMFLDLIFEGNLAKYTVFEPRMLAFKPPEYTMEILVQLCVVTSRCLRIAAGMNILLDAKDESEFLHRNKAQYEVLAGTIEQCAKALASGDASVIDCDSCSFPTTVQNGSAETGAGTESQALVLVPNSDNETEQIESGEGATAVVASAKQHYDPLELHKYVSDVVALTRRWLEAMGPANEKTPNFLSRQSLIGFLKNSIPWIYVHMSHVFYLLMVFKQLFTPSAWRSFLRMDRYELQRLVWCIKYAAGFSILLAIQFYWEWYGSNFVVGSLDSPTKRAIYSYQNAGWAITSYCFATTQTTEGSLKKGILRMAGTVLGALSAWLALLACEDGRYTTQYNATGLVAWMTITSLIATYISTERGFGARIGLSNDYAFGPIYFLITQIIIVCYAFFYSGVDDRGTLAINRMVSNLAGIIVSMILALLPPGNWGGDPGHCKAIIKHHWKSTAVAIRLLLSCQPDSDGDLDDKECKETVTALLELREETIKQSKKMQELAVDFEKDAMRLNKFPLFQVDQKLKSVITKVTRDVYTAAYVPQVAARILSNSEKRSVALGAGSSGRKQLEEYLADIENNKAPGIGRLEVNLDSNLHEISEGEIDLELLFRVVCYLGEEMQAQEEDLDGIQWGVL